MLTWNAHRMVPLLLAIAVIGFSQSAPGAQTWIEDSFDDFADGRLDAGGQNLYVSRDGMIRTIHRFDINNDGYLDLFFGNTHDLQNVVEPTIAWLTDGEKIVQKSLAVWGADTVRSADLNSDGYLDLVFSLASDGLQSPRKSIRIAYGSKQGWTSDRCTGFLPAHRPMSIAIVDLNADHWPDIAVLNSDSLPSKVPPQKKIRVYWGSEDGFLLSRYQDIGGPEVVSLTSGDLDEDGADDLISLTESGEIRVLWSDSSHREDDAFESSLIEFSSGNGGSLVAFDGDADGYLDLVIGTGDEKLFLLRGRKGREWKSPAMLFQGTAFTGFTVDDLDEDGHPDFVLNCFHTTTAAGGEAAGAEQGAESYLLVLWGSEKLLDAPQVTKLPVTNAQSTACGDLNGDGHKDLAVAVYQGEKTFAGQSLFFFGTGNRRFRRCEQTVQTHGASNVVISPARGDFPSQVVFTNSVAGTLHEQVPVYFYWGGADGFNAERRWEIPAQSGHEASAADLNADGFTDLIIPFTGHGGAAALNNPLLGINVFWGSPEGYDLKKGRSVLPLVNPFMDTSNVADINRDGFLDIVVGGWAETDATAIYYGAAGGFELENMLNLETTGRGQGVILADFNRDNWLDLAVSSMGKDRLRIYWGSPDGLKPENQSHLLVPAPIAIQAADLNADGWLDLIAGSYYDESNQPGYFDTGNFIFWGSDQGFRHDNSQWLPGNATLFHVVADFDNNGFLDLFCPNYHSQIRRDTLPSYFYWGSAEGFHWQRRTPLICNSAAGAQAGDFNQDGLVDLAVANHTSFGNHNVDSQVFYNDGKQFANPGVKLLPTRGTHYMWVQDMGHIEDRSWRQSYDSSVLQLKNGSTSGRLDYKAEEPPGTKLVFLVRAAKLPQDLQSMPWRELKQGNFSLETSDRLVQYRALFQSDNGDRFPVLDQVSMHIE